MVQGKEDLVILGRLRGWPLLLWMAVALAMCGYSLWLELSGEGFSDSIFFHMFGSLLGPLVMGASLFAIFSLFRMWRRRNDYLRHDGERLFQGSRKSWPLDTILDVVLIDRPLGKRVVRIVTTNGRQEYLTDSFYLAGRVADLRLSVLRAAEVARSREDKKRHPSFVTPDLIRHSTRRQLQDLFPTA